MTGLIRLLKIQKLTHIKVVTAILSTVIVSGCGETVSNASPVVPCQTSIDTVNFDSKSDMIKFLKTAIPLGSGEVCAFQVMRGNEIKFEYSQIAPTGEKYIHFFEIGWYRIKMFASIGYDRRMVHLAYRDQKLVKLVVN